MITLDARPVLRERSTLSAEAYTVIRAAILRRELHPGKKLNVRELSERLDLSATPVKEALLALSQEGLVLSIPRRGYFVPSIDSSEIMDLYLLRSVIEGLGARLATQHANHQTDHTLLDILGELDSAANTEHTEQYGNLDFRLHQTIWEASGSSRLIKTAETLSGQIRLLMSHSNELPNRLTTSIEEHQRIVDAILNRDAARAEQEMRHHLENAARLMSDSPPGANDQ
ncbi:GntR family transcriptional regulator [Deinococcus peraridilitoris]|uniref:Transcriptional regulator n=1 Tax=Deinococcus peraridilitoris (strain DSM 19664 / LMG 22246 / CIP 109416 / KR-200) TaxID=937777 RepID=L0A8D0_DEIPD|nr:GntR family transcriptional regulator [Deinococcus peraridilitoris]AFZ69335.1 transcriptional regulator [Deinococcus peraridilitoris DSM 19664]